jgi:hypothetical protein
MRRWDPGVYLTDADGCTLNRSRGVEWSPRVCIAMTFFSSDDDTVPRDTLEVLAASSLLQITEFHLFELAYERWFGRQPRERELEACFARYMFASHAPFWVRQYCRDVSIVDSKGLLDPRDFGVLPRRVPDTWVRRGLRHASALLLLIITLHLVAILVSTG